MNEFDKQIQKAINEFNEKTEKASETFIKNMD